MRVSCHACGESFDTVAGALSADCPRCHARVALTAMETRPTPASLVRGPHAGPPPEALLGQEVGGYRLLKVLGGGGMGVVYEAERVGEGPGPALAAIKVLAPAFAEDPDFVERFRREADALLALRHEHLIEVYAKGEHHEPGQAPCYYFVMERFPGRDLRALESGGPVAKKTAAAIIEQAARGLAHAHAQGIVHRDVKPANILVEGDPGAGGRVKVVDFGVAQLAAGPYTLTSLTRSNLVLGTINYMSPEQRLDARAIDHRADVYALAVVAYELLTGRLPLGAFERPSELVPSLPRAVDRVLLAGLRREPLERPADVLSFARELSRALLPAPIRWPRYLAAGTAGAAALLALAVADVRWPRLSALWPGARPRAELSSKVPAVQQPAPPVEQLRPEPPAPSEAMRANLATLEASARLGLELATRTEKVSTRPVKGEPPPVKTAKKKRLEKAALAGDAPPEQLGAAPAQAKPAPGKTPSGKEAPIEKPRAADALDQQLQAPQAQAPNLEAPLKSLGGKRKAQRSTEPETPPQAIEPQSRR